MCFVRAQSLVIIAGMPREVSEVLPQEDLVASRILQWAEGVGLRCHHGLADEPRKVRQRGIACVLAADDHEGVALSSAMQQRLEERVQKGRARDALVLEEAVVDARTRRVAVAACARRICGGLEEDLDSALRQALEHAACPDKLPTEVELVAEGRPVLLQEVDELRAAGLQIAEGVHLELLDAFAALQVMVDNPVEEDAKLRADDGLPRRGQRPFAAQGQVPRAGGSQDLESVPLRVRG